MTTIIGFDPGLTGAWAIIGPGRAEVFDLPVMVARRALNAELLAVMLRRQLVDEHEACLFVLEDVRHIPGTKAGPAAMASLLHSKGVIEGVAGALHHEVALVDAQKWQKLFGLKSMKTKEGLKAAQDRALALYPGLVGRLGRVKDQNRVAALLIAHWGLREYA